MKSSMSSDNILYMEDYNPKVEYTDKVIEFIVDFKAINPVIIEELFSCGYCYWFAKILSERFGGEILYFPVKNHFAVKVNSAIYDITGYYTTPGEAYKWSEYEQVDSLDYQRVVRDCVNKERI